jgi:hypothetical protein
LYLRKKFFFPLDELKRVVRIANHVASDIRNQRDP